MLISEFSLKSGLSRETVRFYVRLGLLHPQTTSKGGRNPYQQFQQDDLAAAELIRVGQALGLSLKEIAVLTEKRRGGKLPLKGRIELMKAQLTQLDLKAIKIERLKTYVRAKIAWQEHGEKGPEPKLDPAI
ncbi:MerR family transcriptional regulator [Terriglobus saanensis]|uniref:Regulatory protein MerR n=1 Tax=Terriglobus saanensis (strain ATCC BAA-1853 / DSM 23119 / SP1PR4) TaxID=401053 RepID=E8UYE0_TERSS|nr:MerR family transcriptional regulator [Terriglobus saanensis]ADV82028.1 regulatory protein MerR [Terriglobus saanensis SP1PR4]